MTKLERAGYTLREPINKARLDELVVAAGPLPDGVRQYLATSDGLRHSERDPILGSKEMLAPYPSNSLLPLKDDGCGNYDAIVIEPGLAFGAVVFWDHESGKAEYLVASSLPMYLEFLATVPISERWSQGGQSQDDFLRARDPGACALLDDPNLRLLIGPEGREFTPEFEPAPAPGQPLPKGAREGINPFTKQRIVIMPHRGRRPVGRQ